MLKNKVAIVFFLNSRIYILFNNDFRALYFGLNLNLYAKKDC